MSESRQVGNQILTIPNILSFCRLAGIPVIFWLVVGPEADLVALIMIAVLAFTDWLDGFLARRWSAVTKLGILLDPLADRLYILTVLAAFVVRGIIPLWFAVLLLLRDVILGVLVLVLARYGHGPVPVNFVGKTGTGLLFGAFPLLLVAQGMLGQGFLTDATLVVGWICAITGLILYWIAGSIYLRQGVALIRSSKKT